MIKMGIIGYGYWGPNVTRAFSRIDGAKVVSICDLSVHMRQRAAKDYPDIDTTSDINDILLSPDIDAVSIITPVSSHFELTKKALQNNKHVFVEKPFTASSEQAEELIEEAQKRKLKIMVDHTFLYTGAVRKIKEIIEKGVLGELYYFDSMRVNLGLFQHDVNVVWDLAPHDLSIMDHIITERPRAIIATGEAHFNGLEDIAYLTVYFQNSMIAHFNVNWLSPVKVRTTLIGGDKKMLVWNDLNVDEKVKVYDKGIEVTSKENIYDLLVSYRSGDMWVPKLDQIEALRLEAQNFVECITQDRTPVNDAQAGWRVVKMLEAASRSLKNKGELVNLS